LDSRYDVGAGWGWPCWLLSVEGWSLMAVFWSFCPPERDPCVAMAGDSSSPFRVRPLVWSDGDQQYVHERNVGTQQAHPALMWCNSKSAVVRFWWMMLPCPVNSLPAS